MTLKTSLVLSGDASGATSALASAEQALAASESQAKALASAFQTADQAVTRLASAQTEAKREVDAAKASYAANETSLVQYNKALLQTKSALSLVEAEHRAAMTALKQARGAMQEAGASAGQQRAAYTNLGRQAQDMAVMLQGGANIGTIIATQGGQVADAVSQMGGKFSGLASFLAGPWGAAIILGVGMLGNLWSAHQKAAEGADSQKDATEDLTKSIALLNDQTLKATRSTEASAQASLVDAFNKRQQAESTLKAAQAELALRKAASGRFEAGMSGWGALMGGGGGNALGYTVEQSAISGAEASIKEQLGNIGKSNATIRGLQGQIASGRLAEEFDASAAASGRFARKMDDLYARLTAGTLSLKDFTREQVAARNALEAEQAAAEKSSGSHNRHAASSRAAAAAAREFAKDMAGLEKTLSEANAAILRMDNQPGTDIYKRLGIDLSSKFLDNVKEPLSDLDQMYADFAEAQKARVKQTNDEAAAAAELRRQYDALGNSLAGLGKGGQTIASLLSVSQGNFGAVGGNAGFLLNQLAGTTWTTYDDNGRYVHQLGDEFTKSLDTFFGGAGEFTKLLQGSGTGMAIGGMVFGASNKAAQAGSAIGGALGSMLGPGGAIVGSLIGGLIGGAFKKTKSGSATVGNVDGVGDVTGSGGNSASRVSAARGLASSSLGALDQIIAQLGGDLGTFSGSIGIRNKKYVVDPSGAGRTKGSGVMKFATEEEASKALLADMIADGAVKGVSAAVEKALKSDSDIEKAFKEALKVQDLELAIGGIGAEMAKQFHDFERQAKERLRIAEKYGFDIVKVEERNAADRLKLSEKLLADQIGSLQQLIADMTSGSLFEGSSVDQRQALLGDIAKAKAEADAGTEGAADKLAGLLGQFNAVSKNVYGTTGGFAADRTSILDQARETIAKANARMTEAQAASDPALATTNAALDENNDQNAQIIAALGSNNALLQQLLASGGTASTTNLGALAAAAGTSNGGLWWA